MTRKTGTCVGAAFAAAIVLAPAALRAQQPLETFLDSAGALAFDVREAGAALSLARSRADEARGRLLPSATAIGTYQRNEYEAMFTNPMLMRPIAIQPFDSLTATFTLAVPIVDVGAWSSFFQAEAIASSAEAQLDATRQTVSATVVRAWYAVVGTRRLVEAAERNVESWERNLETASARFEVGVAPRLELSRAEAELSRARFALADATLQARLAERELEDLTGLAPDDRAVQLEDDLGPEPPLAYFVETAGVQPAERAAREAARAADIARDTAWTTLLPIISGYAREAGSNVTGFTGQNWAWALGLQATWTLDFVRPAMIATSAAAAELEVVRAERAALFVQTGIFEAWQRVDAARAEAESAIDALEAAERAAEDAHTRFDFGASPQLDVIQADRDVFQADVARIRAIAALRVARATLRIRSGMEP
jgi:outer membrane protein